MKKSSVGKQVKVLSIIVFAIIFVAGCVASYYYILPAPGWADYTDYIRFAVGVIASAIVGYLSSIFLYAYGVIIDNTSETASKMEEILIELRKDTNGINNN